MPASTLSYLAAFQQERTQGFEGKAAIITCISKRKNLTWHIALYTCMLYRINLTD